MVDSEMSLFIRPICPGILKGVPQSHNAIFPMPAQTPAIIASNPYLSHQALRVSDSENSSFGRIDPNSCQLRLAHQRTQDTYGPRTTQIYNLRAAISVLLQAGALKAVEGVRDALAAADDALVLVVAERALFADADERGGPHVGVADGAFAVTFVAETSDGDAGLLAAHDEIAGSVSMRRAVGEESCVIEKLTGDGET